MKKSLLWLIAILLTAVIAGVFYQQSNKAGADAPGASSANKPGAKGMNRPVPVGVTTVEKADMDIAISALGTITALNTAVVKARVDGQLVKILFDEGQLVKAGAVLAEIDPRAFQASVNQAQGQLQRDQALLANAELDLARYRRLREQDSIAGQQVDAQAALVAQYRGTVLADRGQVENARLQLEFTKITAPISGRLGLRQIDVGNMIRASDATGLVVITQTQPITAIFSIPADKLGSVLDASHESEKMQVEAFDRDGKTPLAIGELLTIDNQIDTTTGTVKLKAGFDNADTRLFPNLFVNIRLRVTTLKDALTIPSAAISRGSQGTFVYVVNVEDKTVSLRPVTLGPAANERVVIEKGLEASEIVVIDGADKLRNGAKIELPAEKSEKNEKSETSENGKTTAKDTEAASATQSTQAAKATKATPSAE